MARPASISSGNEAPEDWREQFLLSATYRLPEELSSDQTAAWVELVALVGDPDFVAATRTQTVPVWENLRKSGIDAAWWFGRMEDIASRGRAALAKGATPRSVEVQEIVDDWVALFARAAGESPTPDFVGRFARSAPGWVGNADDKTRRLKELLAILDAEDLISSQDRVNELLIAGLRWRAAREASERP